MSRQRNTRSSHKADTGSKRRTTDQHKGTGATVTQSTENPPGSTPYLNRLLPLLLIVVVTFAAYANAWPNNLVYDDNIFENSARYSNLSNIQGYFTQNVWASEGYNTNLYRPLLLASVSLDAWMYGEWFAGYHLTNLLVHLLVTILVYGLLRQLMLKTNSKASSASRIALLATLIFAVHPIHAEAVNSIFNRSEMLVALGGLAGLSWLLRHSDLMPIRAWTGLGLAYFAVLFCKESSVVLPALAAVLVVTLTPGDWRMRIKKSLPVFMLLIPLALYLVLRSHVLEPAGGAAASAMTPVVKPTGFAAILDSIRLPEWNRLLTAAGVWFQSFKHMLWPYPLQVYYEKLPALAQYIGLAVHLLLVSLGIILARQRRFGLILGLAFFYIAVLPASRIVGDPSHFPHQNDRYLYFPSVGPAIILAFGLRYLMHRFDFRISAAVVTIALMILMPVTWARNASWASEVKLYESDYRNGNQSKTVLRLLTSAYLENGNFQKVADVCDRHRVVQIESGGLSVHCAVAYDRTDRHEEAIAAYQFAITQVQSRTVAHANLADFYLREGQWQNAKTHFELAARTESDSAMKEFRQGYMLAQLYPGNRSMLLQAKAKFETALRLQPSLPKARKWLMQVNEQLGIP